MIRKVVWGVVFSIILAGCSPASNITATQSEIIKVIDFELSPDEEKIAFSALTPIGNTDIWVVDIDGTNLRKLTFKDRSPSNHIARFFQKHKWRNFFRIDMRSPQWTKDGRIVFCEEITKHHLRGIRTVGLMYWTINSDGTNKRPKTDKDEVVRRSPFNPIHSFELSDQSEKHKKKFFIKDGILWVLDFGEYTPRRLIQH